LHPCKSASNDREQVTTMETTLDKEDEWVRHILVCVLREFR